MKVLGRPNCCRCANGNMLIEIDNGDEYETRYSIICMPCLSEFKISFHDENKFSSFELAIMKGENPFE